MKNVKRESKVKLKRETVRTLSEQEVSQAAGGGFTSLGGSCHENSTVLSCHQN